MFTEGTLVAGKYRIDRLLGRGGMGIVAAATHVHLGQRVALKILKPELATSEHVVERFVREGRAVAALRGEHVCRVSDVGELDDATPFLVMELLEGTDLARLLTTSGPLSVQRACSYVLQACIGVGEAHALGIIHRDLKPANLFLSHRPDGTPLIKVLDFGIAKAQNTDAEFSLTRTASVLGSPGYMSPEQLKSSRDVDLRTDIWSLGVILFELVSGRRPFQAQSITELAIRVTLDPRPSFVEPMPHGFDQVIDRCLAKEPGHRYPDLANLAHALAAYAGNDGWELANSVSRLIRPTPIAPASSGELALGGMIAPTVPPTGYAGHVAATVPPTGYAPPATVHPTVRPAMAMAAIAPQPTTLGASASSVDVRPTRRHRTGLIAGLVAAAIATIATVATYSVLHRDDGDETAAITQPTPPPPNPTPAIDAAEAPPDAEVAAGTEIDAAAAPADAAEVAATVDAAPEPADAARAKKVIKRRIRHKEDFGETRF